MSEQIPEGTIIFSDGPYTETVVHCECVNNKRILMVKCETQNTDGTKTLDGYLVKSETLPATTSKKCRSIQVREQDKHDEINNLLGDIEIDI